MHEPHPPAKFRKAGLVESLAVTSSYCWIIAGGRMHEPHPPPRFGLGVIGLVKQEPAANDVLFRTRQVGRALWADQRHPGPAENFQALARTPRHRADVLIHSNRPIPGGIAGALVPDADGKEALIRGRPVYPFLVVRRSTLPWKVSIARFASRAQLAGQNGRGHDKSQKAQRASPVHSFILLPGKTKGGLGTRRRGKGHPEILVGTY